MSVYVHVHVHAYGNLYLYVYVYGTRTISILKKMTTYHNKACFCIHIYIYVHISIHLRAITHACTHAYLGFERQGGFGSSKVSRPEVLMSALAVLLSMIETLSDLVYTPGDPNTPK